MHPLTQAARRVAENFDKNHQPLRLLMVNTLAAMIETEVGPVVKALANPVLPDCGCGSPLTLGVCHRESLPCFVPTEAKP